MEVYKGYTKEEIKALQGVEFFNIINEMLADGWSLSGIEKAKIMTKKGLRGRMENYNAYYDTDLRQYVVREGYTIPKMDKKEVQNVSDIVSNDVAINEISEDTITVENTNSIKKDYKIDTNIHLKQLEAAIGHLTQEIIKLNTNGITVHSPKIPAINDSLDSVKEFVPKKFSKEDVLINRNHRFHKSVLDRLKAFCDVNDEYTLQVIINTLLSEALDKYDR